MAKIIISCLALSLAACAAKPVVWDKPGATQIGFAQDRYQCQLETEHTGNFAAIGAPLFVALAAGAAQKRQQGMFAECMEARGYEIVKNH